MDLLMPVIGYIVATVGAITILRIAINSGKKAIAGNIMNATTHVLNSAAQTAITQGRAGIAGNTSFATNVTTNAATTGIRMASNSAGLNATVDKTTMGQNGKAQSVLREAEAIGRTTVGVVGVATAPLSVAAGVATKATGKASQVAGKKVNGAMKYLGEKRYKKEYGDREAKVDANIEKNDALLKDKRKNNNERIMDAAKNKRLAEADRNELKKKKDELVDQKRKNGTASLEKEKKDLEEALNGERDPRLRNEIETDLQKINNELEIKSNPELDKQIEKVNAELLEAEGRVDNADNELKSAQSQKQMLMRAQQNQDEHKKRLLDQRKIRHDEYMKRYQLSRTGNALEAVGTGLNTIGNREMRMGLDGARQIGKAITGKDFFTDKLFAPKGTRKRLVEEPVAVAPVAVQVEGQKLSNGEPANLESNKEKQKAISTQIMEGNNQEMAGMGMQMAQFIYNDLTTTTVKNSNGSMNRFASTSESNKIYTGTSNPEGNNMLLQIQANQVGTMQGNNFSRYEKAFKEMIGRYNQEMMSQGKEGIPEGTKIAQQAAQQYALMQHTNTEAIREAALNEFEIDNKKKETIEKIAEKSPQVQGEINKRVEELSKYIPEQSSDENKKRMEEVIKSQVNETVVSQLKDGGDIVGQIYGENIEKQIKEQMGKIDLQASVFADGKVEEAKIKEMMEEINKNPDKYANLNAEQIGNSIDQKKMEEMFRKMFDAEINKSGGKISSQGNLGIANVSRNSNVAQGGETTRNLKIVNTEKDPKVLTFTGPKAKRLGTSSSQKNVG